MKKLILLLPLSALIFACGKSGNSGSAPFAPVDIIPVSVNSLQIPASQPLNPQQLRELRQALGSTRFSPDPTALMLESNRNFRNSKKQFRSSSLEAKDCRIVKPHGSTTGQLNETPGSSETTTTTSSISGSQCDVEYSSSDSITTRSIDISRAGNRALVSVEAEISESMRHRDPDLVAKTGSSQIESHVVFNGKISSNAEVTKMYFDLDKTRTVSIPRYGRIPMIMKGAVAVESNSQTGLGNIDLKGYATIQMPNYLVVVGVTLANTQEVLNMSKLGITLNGVVIDEQKLAELTGLRLKLALPAQSGVSRLQAPVSMSDLLLELLPANEVF